MAWVGAAAAIANRAAQGLATRFGAPAFEPFLQAIFLIFLAVIGFRLLDTVATRSHDAAEAFALPLRLTCRAEAATGAALGWALALAAVLPLLLTLNLHSRIVRDHGNAGAVAGALATLLMVSLAEEVVFRGYPLQRLVRAVGPSVASVLLSIGFSFYLLGSRSPSHVLLALVGGTLFGILLSMAWLRTHALWLGWGLHFAYRAVTAIVLGLPIAGHAELPSIVSTDTFGPTWLNGGTFGPDAALFTLLVLLVGMAVLYRLTRDWAWAYTHREILPAGYEVTIAPPAAHTEMERVAAAPPPLVQILPVTSQQPTLRDDLTTRS